MRIILLFTLSQIAQAQLYQAPAVCETRVHDPVSVRYKHPLTGLERTVPIIVEEPLSVAGAMPVVVWMHGGAGGGTPQNLAEWRGVTARACYLSVTIGHAWPDEAQARKLCAWMGRRFPDDCGEARQGQVKLLNVERPFDLRAVLDHLLTEWKDQVDPDRIAVGGHSAGAGAALMAAGAVRDYENRREVFSDPRPRAFLAFSPQGPGNDGFSEKSWDGVKLPVLIGTGAGDATGGESPTDRIKAFEALPGPDKHLLYVDDEAAPHGRFGLGRSRCASTGGSIPEPDCDRVISWLGATAVAFLDAYVRERGEALDWLNGGGVEKATGGMARMRTQ